MLTGGRGADAGVAERTFARLQVGGVLRGGGEAERQKQAERAKPGHTVSSIMRTRMDSTSSATGCSSGVPKDCIIAVGNMVATR